MKGDQGISCGAALLLSNSGSFKLPAFSAVGNATGLRLACFIVTPRKGLASFIKGKKASFVRRECPLLRAYTGDQMMTSPTR
jgi:hypothetical protein